AVVGAGLSGVEVASELRESRSDLKIYLFDRKDRILFPYPEKLSRYVEEWFVKHKVNIIRNSNITKVEPNIVYNHDEPLECDAIVWTAGIQANEAIRELPIIQDSIGRLVLTKN
ncbi:FAD-dependent oxidoreductase, partial [Priestia sp. SIMBA_032]|uniref:FAD-dependent oxidoreductase n=1 Tax=Priestia sp. SIMBA_032 TaxID=3085775 RepID=UPI003978AC99